jgi:hypothetical protein
VQWTEIIRLWWKQQKDFLPKLRAQAERYKAIDNASELPKRVLEESSPIFVLSTGRAGTQYLTSLFDSLKGFHSEHEPQPELLYASRWAYEHKDQEELLEAAFLAGRYELIRNSFLEGKTYVETNNRLSFLAPGIAKAFPKARFVHLIRHPEAFVRSGIQRKWYSNEHLTDEGRIQVPLSLSSLSEEEKIAWLWNTTNEEIAKFGELLPKDKFIEIQSESLFKSLETNRSLFSFLQLEYPGDSFILNAQQRPKNSSRKNPAQVSLTGKWKEHVPFAKSRSYSI